ncbi:hypothetical protein [Clostridium colicanis]|uniref:Uncharacterized protein n=1 Tax=Clostridium colicanis DSM 13634 TaxID=1121305 RepID=A0A151AMM9_9CLOT|nr:hypothetical protein [Clostridium colicanis]KYH28888.1 hypothetical protein CLCOL_16200 [Clostridium colicanis DSM 13634]
MRRIIKFLSFTFLIICVISINAFAASTNDVPNEKRSNSEVFYSNNNYDLTLDTQSTTSDTFIDWGSSIAKIDIGLISVTGLTESYVTVDTIGYTLYVEKYENGSWHTIKTFSNRLNNSKKVSGNHTLSVASDYYYRVRSINYIIDNGIQTSKTSATDPLYVY